MPRRALFHFEAPEDGGGGMAVAEPVEAPTAEPTPSEPEATAPESFAISREEWEQTQAGLAQVAQYLQAQQYAGQEEPEAEFDFALDPLEDDFGAQLAQLVQNVVQQSLSPIMEYQQQQRLGEGEERARDILADIASADGEFVEQDAAFAHARALANTYLAEEAERWGWGPRAGEAALRRAAADLRARDKAIEAAAIERYKNQIAGLAGAPSEPGVSGSGTQVYGGQRPDSLKDIARRFGGSSA